MFAVTEEFRAAIAAVDAMPASDLPTVDEAVAMAAGARQAHRTRLLVRDDGTWAAGVRDLREPRACRVDAIIRAAEALRDALLGAG